MKSRNNWKVLLSLLLVVSLAFGSTFVIFAEELESQAKLPVVEVPSGDPPTGSLVLDEEPESQENGEDINLVDDEEFEEDEFDGLNLQRDLMVDTEGLDQEESVMMAALDSHTTDKGIISSDPEGFIPGGHACKDNKYDRGSGTSLIGSDGDQIAIKVGEDTFYVKYKITRTGRPGDRKYQYFSWENLDPENFKVNTVIIGGGALPKGKSNHFIYDYSSSEYTEDSNLRAPKNFGGQIPDISHVIFCAEKITEPPETFDLTINKVILDKNGDLIENFVEDYEGMDEEPFVVEVKEMDATNGYYQKFEGSEALTVEDAILAEALLEGSYSVKELLGKKSPFMLVGYQHGDYDSEEEVLPDISVDFEAGDDNKTVTIVNQIKPEKTFSFWGYKEALDINWLLMDDELEGWKIVLHGVATEQPDNDGGEAQMSIQKYPKVPKPEENEWIEREYTLTDAEGKFEFEGLSSGWYKVTEELTVNQGKTWIQIWPYEYYVYISPKGKVFVERSDGHVIDLEENEMMASAQMETLNKGSSRRGKRGRPGKPGVEEILFTNMQIPHITVEKLFAEGSSGGPFTIWMEPVIADGEGWTIDGAAFIRSISAGENIFLMEGFEEYLEGAQYKTHNGFDSSTAIPPGVYRLTEQYNSTVWKAPVYNPAERIIRFALECYNDTPEPPDVGEQMGILLAVEVNGINGENDYLCYLYPDASITNELIEVENGGGTPTPGGGGGGGTRLRGTFAAPETVEVTDPVIPEGAPEVRVPDPVIPEVAPEVPIVLDEEPPPLGVPALPQTGEGNPLYFYLAGLLLAGTGLAIRKTGKAARTL